MNKIVNLLILILANWRLTSLVVDESGPGEVLDYLRHLAGVRERRDSNNRIIERYGTNTFADGLVCIWCASVWVGGVLTFLSWMVKRDHFTGDAWLAMPFFLSATTIFIFQKVRVTK